MLREWRKFAGWKILCYFLSNPNVKIHIKGVARELKVGSNTAAVYCKLYEKNGILKSERVANTIRFCLNNDDAVVKALKKFWFLALMREKKVVEKFLEKNKGIVCVVLYGAHASGEYSSESDVDILVLSQVEKIDITPFSDFGSEIGKNVEIVKFTVGKWRNLVKGKDSFAESVLKNNVLLWGSEI